MATDAFRTAARAYLAYGVVYWLGGTWLVWQGVGQGRGMAFGRGAVWVVAGLALVVAIPWLLAERRPWFERWILSRRDFARLLAVFMAFRALKVAELALRADAGAPAGLPGGDLAYRAGTLAFFVVTLAALALVARAAWGRAGQHAP